MAPVPPVRYARTGGLHIAYQVVGDGPVDLVYLSEWVLPLETRWHESSIAQPLWRLAAFSRLISFDRRGAGCSDPGVPGEQSAVEEWMDDCRIVMDEVGSSRAFLLGAGESGMSAMLFTATFPERVAGLVLVNTTARFVRGDGYPVGFPADALDPWLQNLAEDWSSGATARNVLAGLPPDHPFLERFASWRRSQCSPATATALHRVLMTSDVRHVLAMIQAPTLVLHRAETSLIRAGHGRYLAEHIPGARYVELDGANDVWWAGDTDAVVDEIEEFLTGSRPVAEPDRMLATVLFTDIVDSTRRAAELGDRRWRSLLDQHDDVIRRELHRYRGREIKVVGDGFLATFDGPARAIRCGCAITKVVQSLGLEVRVGLHTGEVELRGEDIAGVAVHIGARVAALAGPGQVLVSGAIPPLVAGSGLEFRSLGLRELKGVPGEWAILAVVQ